MCGPCRQLADMGTRFFINNKFDFWFWFLIVNYIVHKTDFFFFFKKACTYIIIRFCLILNIINFKNFQKLTRKCTIYFKDDIILNNLQVLKDKMKKGVLNEIIFDNLKIMILSFKRVID